MVNPLPRPNAVCNGPVSYRDLSALRRDLDNLARSLGDKPKNEAFIAAIAPADVAWIFENRFYASDEEYLYALGEALRTEYLDRWTGNEEQLMRDEDAVRAFDAAQKIYAGQSVGLIGGVKPAGEIVRALARDAQARLHTLHGVVEGPG